MNSSYLTDTGRVRESNEDSLFVDQDIGLFMVADGMGGHRAGEVASKMAVDSISGFVKRRLSRRPEDLAAPERGRKRDSLKRIVREAMSRASIEIFETSRPNPDFRGMGTTVVVAMIERKRLHIANVGDSRAYLIRNGKIKQLTKDHSRVGELLRAGLLSREEARFHPERNILTAALGVGWKIEPDVLTVNVRDGDCIVLCTDGLTDMLADEEIRDIITSYNLSLDSRCRELIDQANERGGRDNITAVLIEIPISSGNGVTNDSV